MCNNYHLHLHGCRGAVFVWKTHSEQLQSICCKLRQMLHCRLGGRQLILRAETLSVSES